MFRCTVEIASNQHMHAKNALGMAVRHEFVTAIVTAGAQPNQASFSTAMLRWAKSSQSLPCS